MTVHSEKSGPVTTVINDRINARNAGDPETADALTDAFLAFDADAEAKVAVFWGAGGAFCAGWDLKYAATLADPDKFRAEIVEGLAIPQGSVDGTQGAGGGSLPHRSLRKGSAEGRSESRGRGDGVRDRPVPAGGRARRPAQRLRHLWPDRTRGAQARMGEWPRCTSQGRGSRRRALRSGQGASWRLRGDCVTAAPSRTHCTRTVSGPRCLPTGRNGLFNQWIDDRDVGKTPEIAIGGPQFAHAMLLTQRRYACIVNLRPNCFST